MTARKPSLDPKILERALSPTAAQDAVDRIHTPTMKARLDALAARNGASPKDLMAWEGFVDAEPNRGPPETGSEATRGDELLQRELEENPFRAAPSEAVLASLIGDTKEKLRAVAPGSEAAVAMIREAVERGAPLDAFMDDAAPEQSPPLVVLGTGSTPATQQPAATQEQPDTRVARPVESERSPTSPARSPNRGRHWLLVVVLLGLGAAAGVAVQTLLSNRSGTATSSTSPTGNAVARPSSTSSTIPPPALTFASTTALPAPSESALPSTVPTFPTAPPPRPSTLPASPQPSGHPTSLPSVSPPATTGQPQPAPSFPWLR